jgi:hypothetical protein
MVITKKVVPEYFKDLESGLKNFEARLNRFRCKAGDILVLREWDPQKKEYTGRFLKKGVKYVLKTKNIEKFWSKEEVEKYGFQIIAFK